MANTYTWVHIHYVFSTKNRLPVLSKEIRERLWPYMGGIARENDMLAKAVGGAEDHAHLLLSLPTTLTISKGIQLIKGGYSFAARALTSTEIWHTGHHEHRIRDIDDYANQLRYIANNPSSAALLADYPYVHVHPQHAGFLDASPAHILS